MYVFVRKDIDFFQVSMLGQFKQPTLEVIGMKSHSWNKNKSSIKQNNNLNKKTPNVKTNAFYSLL